MKIPEIKNVYRLCIAYAIRKKSLEAWPEQISICETLARQVVENDFQVGYSIAGFNISHQFNQQDGECRVVSCIEGIVVDSAIIPFEKEDAELIARLMAHDAHKRIPGLFNIVNSDPWYLISSMECKETTKPLVSIDNPLRFIEITSIDTHVFDLGYIQQCIKQFECDNKLDSPFREK